MMGWKRLWIALSLLFGAPIFFIYLDASEEKSTYLEAPDPIRGLRGDAFFRAM